jgi:dTMP kinase
MHGIFITFEGPEGAGKSTQLQLLAADLERAGRRVCRTREPGGTEIGERIRDVLLAASSGEMCAETESLLHTAARAQHVRELIRPALERGEVVLSDRFVESTLAYQGGGRGLPRDELREIQRLATGGLTPDLRILLDLPVELGLKRRLGDLAAVNRMDVEGVEFHKRVRAEYLAMASAEPDGWTIIDASRAPEEVARDVLRAVQGVLAGADSRERSYVGSAN